MISLSVIFLLFLFLFLFPSSTSLAFHHPTLLYLDPFHQLSSTATMPEDNYGNSYTYNNSGENSQVSCKTDYITESRSDFLTGQPLLRSRLWP
jgi:hypothetical protein